MDVRFLLDAETPLAPPVYADYFTILKGGPVKPAAPAGHGRSAAGCHLGTAALGRREAGETQWQVLLSTNGTDYTAGAVLPADSTAYLLSGLTANAPVFVKAVVTNPAGSAASAPLTYKHPSAPVPVSLMEPVALHALGRDDTGSGARRPCRCRWRWDLRISSNTPLVRFPGAAGPILNSARRSTRRATSPSHFNALRILG